MHPKAVQNNQTQTAPKISTIALRLSQEFVPCWVMASQWKHMRMINGELFCEIVSGMASLNAMGWLSCFI